MSAKNLQEAILDELEITQGTAENIAAILNESPAAVRRVLETLLRGEEVRLAPPSNSPHIQTQHQSHQEQPHHHHPMTKYLTFPVLLSVAIILAVVAVWTSDLAAELELEKQ